MQDRPRQSRISAEPDFFGCEAGAFRKKELSAHGEPENFDQNLPMDTPYASIIWIR